MTTALIVGATGLVGSACLDRLLADPGYDRVVALTRRPVGRTHAKLDNRVVDFAALTAADVPAADHVYCALGTTIKVAGSQEVFHAIDHDYPLAVARLARDGGAQGFALVSSIGANPGARAFYLRVKGVTERDITAVGYPTLEIFRPSLLLGERAERRPLEKVMFGFWRVASGLLAGPMRRYRAVPAETVAAAMIAALRAAEPGTHIRDHDAIRVLAG